VNRTDRLYALVEELRVAGARGRTAAQLAEHFEVGPRTIKRDVSALQQSGVPIWATPGPGGGYVLDAAATLPPLTFTAGEATAIAVALAAQSDLPFAPDGRAALAKVLGGMTDETRQRTIDLAGRVWMRPEEHSPGRSPVARVIDEALREQVVVVLDYVDRSGTESERRPVEPLTFARDRGRWYLLAWCRRRRAGRWFRLDRITGARLTTERVAPRDLVEVFGPPPSDALPLDLT
jgi:predicted DNA-binding transcriptional regulator YafY